ncbi:hypothetical protein As57867_005285, partial [Aphanomyces stellatus]
GSISYYPSGKVDDSKVSILGSGNAYLGSIQSQTTSVETLGRGTAYVQAVDTLKRTGFGSGSIKYFNVTPVHLPKEKKHHWLSIFPSPKVERTGNNTFETLTVAPEPALNEGTHVHIVVHTGWWPFWSEQKSQVATPSPPKVEFETGDAAPTNLARLGYSGSSSVEDFGLSSLAVVVVALLAFVVFKKTRRTGYQPLQ